MLQPRPQSKRVQHMPCFPNTIVYYFVIVIIFNGCSGYVDEPDSSSTINPHWPHSTGQNGVTAVYGGDIIGRKYVLTEQVRVLGNEGDRRGGIVVEWNNAYMRTDQARDVSSGALGHSIVLAGHGMREYHEDLLASYDGSNKHGTLGQQLAVFTTAWHGMTNVCPPLTSESSSSTYQPSRSSGELPELPGPESDGLGGGMGDVKYKLGAKVGRGAHGEVWRATLLACPIGSIDICDGANSFILKRMFLEKGDYVRFSGLREIHFGNMFKGFAHIARFSEFFESYAPDTQNRDTPWDNASRFDGEERTDGDTQPMPAELWLVFKDEGRSLFSYLYRKVQSSKGGPVIMEPSQFSKSLRHTAAGAMAIKEVIRQVLVGLSLIHSKGVTHRDIKPGNLIVTLGSTPEVRIADFGSAIDPLNMDGLYPGGKASRMEGTKDYEPPEARFGGEPFDKEIPTSYDIWSLGVTMMEILAGTPKIFQVDKKTEATLRQKMHCQDEDTIEKACSFQAMLEACIYRPRLDETDKRHTSALALSEECTEKSLHMFLEKLGVSIETNGILLLVQMLKWDPRDRISAEEALRHPYFRSTTTEEWASTGRNHNFALYSPGI